MTGTGSIAVIANRPDEDIQALLAAIASDWAREGVKVVGVLSENPEPADGSCSAGFLRDIASGERFSIHLDQPPADTTCHMDAAGIEDANRRLLAQIAAGDVVLLSKFGKLEVARQGLWAAFSAAVAAGKPVLTTVSSRQMGAWKDAVPTATWLDPSRASIERWWRGTRLPVPGSEQV